MVHMKNRFQNLIQLFKRLKNTRFVIQLGNEGNGETKAISQIHIQQPVKAIDDITKYGFYRASICLNPGQTALIFNSNLYEAVISSFELAEKSTGIKYTDVLKSNQTQIIKN